MSSHRASVVVKPGARRDFRAILLYTYEHWGAAQRDTYRDEINQAFDRLSTYPLSGRARDEIAPGLRSLPVQEHIIFYRVEAATVVVLRILHQNMDAARHLRA